MVRTRPSQTPEELLAKLDALPSEDFEGVGTSLSRLSALKMLDERGVNYEVLNARFSGSLPAEHEIAVRSVAAVLGEFQDAIAEVGAVLREVVPQRGPLPQDVERATELRLSPRLSSGSVVFSMHPAEPDAQLWDEGQTTLLDGALSKLFGMFDDIEKPASTGGNAETVVELLRELGPRTARHLLKFAEALEQDGLDLDLGWTRSGHQLVRSTLTRPGASFLREVAKQATTRERTVTLRGLVRNLGDDNRHKIADDERGLIIVTSSDAVTDVLHPSFRHGRVELEALETEVINVATGRTTRSYQAISAVALFEDEGNGA